MAEELKITINDQAMLAVVEAAVFDCPLQIIEGADYRLVFNELRAHALVGLTADIFKKLPLDDELRKEWTRAVMLSIFTNHRVMDVERTVLEAFSRAGVSCVVLKGSAAAMYYPRPELRERGDIDLFPSEEYFEAAMDCLLAMGAVVLDHGKEAGRHASFIFRDVTIELHRYFFQMSSMGIGGKEEDELLQDCVCYRQSVNIGEYCIPVAPEKINGLILLWHMRQHLIEGLGLRQIVDWMMFVDSVLDDDTWNSGFACLANEAGVDKLACAITCLCQHYLGLDESIAWCREYFDDDELCWALLEDILGQGNFGRKKIGDARKIESIASANYDLADWAKRLQRGGMVNWGLARRNKLAACFAWAYQIGIIASRMFSNDALFGNLAAQKRGRERKTMLKRLGLKYANRKR